MRRLFLCVGIYFLLAGCADDDLAGLRRDLNSQAERLAALEALQEEINGNLLTLQVLVGTLGDAGYITSVSEVGSGYTITLSDGRLLHIRHGARGDKGPAGGAVLPSVAVRDSSDGHTYWTVNGRLLTDASGHGARADGEKGDPGVEGAPGIAGVTPQVRINASTNEWEVSVDGGRAWTSMGVCATGNDGDKGDPGDRGESGPAGPAGSAGSSVFAREGVKVYESYVEFTLSDALGTMFRVPRYKRCSLSFPVGLYYRMPRCVEKDIPFVLSGGVAGAMVSVFGNGGWHAEVRPSVERADSGVILVRAPEDAGSADIVVLLGDGAGSSWSYRLSVKALPTPRMVRVPGGSLHIMGPAGEGWRLSEYWISETEVTFQQYCDFLNDLVPVPTLDEIEGRDDDSLWFYPSMSWALPEYVSGRWEPFWGDVLVSAGVKEKRSLRDYPFKSMWWHGAMAYCRWAGGSLPTEAQWEYAARGGDRNPAAVTDIYSGGNNLSEVGWWNGNKDEIGTPWGGEVTKGTIHPVGTKRPNFLGIYDMSGNVAEWCLDWMGDIYPAGGKSPGVDPQGPVDGTSRVIRGGSYSAGFLSELMSYCEVGCRRSLVPSAPNSKNLKVGFRLVYMK